MVIDAAWNRISRSICRLLRPFPLPLFFLHRHRMAFHVAVAIHHHRLIGDPFGDHGADFGSHGTIEEVAHPSPSDNERLNTTRTAPCGGPNKGKRINEGRPIGLGIFLTLSGGDRCSPIDRTVAFGAPQPPLPSWTLLSYSG